jgi:hypothetical protein
VSHASPVSYSLICSTGYPSIYRGIQILLKFFTVQRPLAHPPLCQPEIRCAE